MKTQFDVVAFETALNTIRENEQSTKDLINDWGPLIVEAVRSGHSIDKVKQLGAVLNKDRKKQFFLACNKFVDNKLDVDKLKFGKKDPNKSAQTRNAKRWEQFKESGAQFYTLLEPVARAKKTEVTPKQKIERHFQQIKKLAPTAHMTKKELLAMFALVMDIELAE